MADQGQKTEEPTERRIRKSREEGNFPASKEFVSAVQFMACVGLMAAYAAESLMRLREVIRFLLGLAFQREVDAGGVFYLYQEFLLPAAVPLLLAGALVMAITLGVQLGTTRMGLSLKKLTPDLKRLSPLKKIKNMPRQNIPQFLQALVMLPLFGAAIYAVVNENLATFLGLPLLQVDSGIHQVGASVEAVLWRAAGLFLVMGVIDLIRQRRRYRKDLRMSKQEVRDEFKEVEGNPQIKGRIRRLQRDLLRRQMMSEIPDATAVIVNPTHYAVALRYQLEATSAPKVVAKGKNYLALRIRKKAIEHEVPIVENPPLARALYESADVGQFIPVELYRAVAEILAYIFRLMNGRLPGRETAAKA